ncbi:phage minor structural protein [Bacillus sp. L_1B0_8]|uniref:phage tail spike protein n=1 Tax=Bacillus TaxID=1386 RepID=UPI0005B6F472|nr:MULTISPECIES: phage tail spike protein [unclassified Bacillus (in: firmicutes)]KIQ87519.1 phage minor structural protein [Bacillus sp. L_1B0_5]KIQ91816.1 phage minor structural protein [Bacillus sp. L_1B0_8]
MRTPSGVLHIIDFKTSQIVSAIQPKDYWDDKRHWEIKNNIDTLEFKVFDNTKYAATLMQQNLVLKEVRDGRIVPYVITEVEKDPDDRSVITYASGAWINLAKDDYIRPQKIEGKTVNEFMDIALVGVKWQRGKTEYAGFRSMTIDEFIDPLSFLKKIASLFELEIIYRVEVVGSKIVGWYVDMVKKRGRETGKEVTLGKDLIGIKRIENSQNICTALIGYIKKEGGEVLTISDINKGIPYIVDNDAFQRWNEKGKHKFGFYTPETEEDITPERLLTLMKTELAKRVNTSVSYDVQAQSMGRVFGLAHELINEGDTIRIKDVGFTPKLYLEARAIAGDESHTDPSQDKYAFGDYSEIVDPNDELRKIYNRILSSLGSKQELIDQLDKLVKDANETANNAKKESEVAKTLAEKVQENLKNNAVNIIEAKNPPTDNLIVGKTLWRDISNGKPGILKVWNGKGWELLIPDVETIKKETMERVNKDIKLTEEELNKKVEEAQSETTGRFKEVKNSLQEVSQTIKNVQNFQGEINKTVSEMKQTNEGFTKSIELLTKKDGEITGKLNTVEETFEGTKKTISEVQQTTNALKKTTTEITEKAGQISEKLESVEKKVNNDKAGGRNLLLDSNAKYEKTDYLINPYSLTENFSTGEEYTFVIKGSVPKGQKFGIWQNGGSNNVGYATSVYANGITYVTFKAVAATSGNERKLSLYNFPSNTTKAIVEWVALYKGNKPQDWTPAPENQVTSDEFTKKTTEIEKSVDGIKESIKTVEKTKTSFNERVNTVEKNAEGTTASVKKLQETQTEQGKTLTQAATTIQQHSEALKLTMKKKDVEDYVGGLGTVNELRDADFKLGQKYWFWNSGNGAIGSVDTNLKYKGMNTFAITVTGQTQDRWWGLTSQFIECQVNEEFVASGYFNTDGKTPIDSGGAFIEIEWWTGDKKTRIKTARTNIKVVNHTWVRAVCSDKAPANASFVRWRYYVTRNGRLWCTAPMLQRGTIATEFWLHPKDQTDVDKMLEDIANRVATEKYNQKVTELERSIGANEKGITIVSRKQETFINETYNAYARKTESRLEVLDEGILAQILKDGIVTAINMSPGKITINAAKLDINADTMVKWLTAKGIDTNLIRINGDKITIDKDGVTVKMLDFLFQDEWGTKTTAVSRRNLIADPDFSSVTKKNIGHNDYYGFEGGYGLTWKSWGNVVIEKNTHIFDYEQMVNATRVDMYNYPEAIVNNGIHPGNEYTVSAHFRASMINGVRKTGKPRLHVCCVKFRDNVSYDIWNEQKMDFPEPSTFYGEIRRYSFTFKVPKNYIPQQHALIIKVCSGSADMRQGTAICVSGVTLYSGKYASMYNWDRAAAERADGIQPFNALAVGGVNNNIKPAADGQTFDISTEKDVKVFSNIRAMQGINLGGGGFQQWGHVRFVEGNRGLGFYVCNSNGWHFNSLG